MAVRHRKEKVKVSEIRRLSGLMCTPREAAGFLGIREKTFLEMIRVDEAAKKAWEEGCQIGKVGLRRKQFRLADTSAPMAIFLGRNYLGQSDVTIVQHSGPEGGPITTMDLSNLDKDQRKVLRDLLVKAQKKKAE